MHLFYPLAHLKPPRNCWLVWITGTLMASNGKSTYTVIIVWVQVLTLELLSVWTHLTLCWFVVVIIVWIFGPVLRWLVNVAYSATSVGVSDLKKAFAVVSQYGCHHGDPLDHSLCYKPNRDSSCRIASVQIRRAYITVITWRRNKEQVTNIY